ncbi:MAG: BamA/TamA family outer membrane protein [Mariniblastus sp.]|nr:BamA/TamA family outer membrane protein [Mariniblastus sp.]
MKSISTQSTTRVTLAWALPLLVLLTGCQSGKLFNESNALGLSGKNQSGFSSLLASAQTEKTNIDATVEERRWALAGIESNKLDVSQVFAAQGTPGAQPPKIVVRPPTTVRAQSPDNDSGGFGFPQKSPTKTDAWPTQDNSIRQAGGEFTLDGSKTVQADESGAKESSQVEKSAYQFPELATPDRVSTPGNGLPSPNIGSPNEMNPIVQPFERGGNAPLPFPMNYADLDIYVSETQTGRINFGGAYNSDNGIVGQFIVDEKNFDITRWPRNFREITDGTAWRGAGQNFRMELVPGANLERYLVSFTEPYMLGTDYSFSASAYLFERQYYDWDEKRVGGRFSIGRRLTQDLSISAGLRMESVTIDNPRVDTSTQLNDTLGNSNLFLGNVGLIRDTRDSSYAATEGSYFSLSYSQAFGDYSYGRGDLDYRRYKLMYQRPDGSGRHTLSFGTKLGFSGKSTPLFENYYAGGFSTLRGFDFRGAAPLDGGVRVGGEFQWLNSLEYMFPLAANDMVKGVLFCDFGTVEEGIELNAENFRVAPGFGFRVSMPGMGIGAPLAFDFAFPVSTADGDDEKVFSFYLGVLR